jgi:hypothetical protein
MYDHPLIRTFLEIQSRRIHLATKRPGTSNSLKESKYDKCIAASQLRTSAFMNFDFRSVWAALSLSHRLFLLFFGGVLLYTLCLSFRVMYCLNSLKKQEAGNSSSVSELNRPRKRLGNLRQLHLLTLYVLGLCLVINIPNTFNVTWYRGRYPVGQLLERIAFLFNYYVAFFIAFIFLHCVQWLVSSRVDGFEWKNGG